MSDDTNKNPVRTEIVQTQVVDPKKIPVLESIPGTLQDPPIPVQPVENRSKPKA